MLAYKLANFICDPIVKYAFGKCCCQRMPQEETALPEIIFLLQENK